MGQGALVELGTEHAPWCQTAAGSGPCRATIKAGQVKAVTVADDGGLTVTLTADDGNQIVLTHHAAQAVARHITATTNPQTIPVGGAR